MLKLTGDAAFSNELSNILQPPENGAQASWTGRWRCLMAPAFGLLTNWFILAKASGWPWFLPGSSFVFPCCDAFLIIFSSFALSKVFGDLESDWVARSLGCAKSPKTSDGWVGKWPQLNIETDRTGDVLLLRIVGTSFPDLGRLGMLRSLWQWRFFLPDSAWLFSGAKLWQLVIGSSLKPRMAMVFWQLWNNRLLTAAFRGKQRSEVQAILQLQLMQSSSRWKQIFSPFVRFRGQTTWSYNYCILLYYSCNVPSLRIESYYVYYTLI